MITPLDPDELRRIARDIAKRRIRTVAITSVFSPVNTEVERQAGEIIAAAVPARMSRRRATSAGSGSWSARMPPS